MNAVRKQGLIVSAAGLCFAFTACSTTNDDLDTSGGAMATRATLDRSLTIDPQPDSVRADRTHWEPRSVEPASGSVRHPAQLTPSVLTRHVHDPEFPSAIEAIEGDKGPGIQENAFELGVVLVDGVIDALWLFPGAVLSAFHGPSGSPEYAYETRPSAPWLDRDINADRTERFEQNRNEQEPGGVVIPGRGAQGAGVQETQTPERPVREAPAEDPAPTPSDEQPGGLKNTPDSDGNGSR